MINYFSNRELVIATCHGKEKVIAPVLLKALGLKNISTSSFDTDQFGSFCGKYERKGSVLDTLRSKCERAYEESGTDLVLASEGSFGAHPVLAFCQADEEFLMLKDFRNDLEIVAKTISTQTNLSNKRIHNLEELLSFSHEIGFPSHALILKPLENGLDGLVKGINDESELIRVFKLLNSQYESVYAETDMRAMFNPTRMIVIEEAAHKLVEIVNSCCPECSTPGFWVSKTNSGLRCSQCGLPTKSILSLEKVCKKCDYTELVKYPNEKEYEDPTYCDICNP